MMRRRRLIQGGGSLVLLLGAQHIVYGAGIVAVRVWPANDYTRVTIESDNALKTEQRFVENPPRLALDIQGLELDPQLRELVGKIRPGDPYISGVRVGQNAPGVVRLVLDLKQPVAPQVFTLQPVAAYRHRLVLDLYPKEAVDPMESLIAERLRDAPVPGVGKVPEPGAHPSVAGAVPAPASAVDPLGELITQRNGPSGSTGSPIAPTSPTSPQVASRAGMTPPTPASPSLPLTPPVPLGSAVPPLVAAAPARPPVNPPLQGRPAATASRTDRIIIVALDPGHGGEDPGAQGASGTREKDVVLLIAHKLRDRINASTVNGNPMRAFMTRDDDFFVPLQVRVQKARRVQADLFVSIHADAFSNPDARGASVFALSQSGASSTAARWLANKENQADLVGGINVRSQDLHVQRAMLDMSTTAQINDSIKLGSAMIGEFKTIGARMHKGQVEQAGFAVLKAPDIPSVLVETAFISNPDEEAKLRSTAYQDSLADALMRGIQRYFAQNPPMARSRQL